MTITRRGLVGAAAAGTMLSAFPAPFVRAQTKRPLVFWHNFTQQARADHLRAVADKFESENRDIAVSIEVVPFPAYAQRWPAARAANGLPDVTTLEAQNAIPMFMAGALNPMDGVLKALGSDTVFTSNLLDAGRFQGSIISTPFYAHNRIMIYRKDRLQEAGLSVPQTWEQALKAAVATTKAPDHYGWILKLSREDNGGGFMLWIMTQSAGGSFFDADGNVTFNSQPVRDAAEFMAEIARTASGPSAVTSKINDNFNLMSSGKQSLTEDSCALISVASAKAPEIAAQLEGTSMPRREKVGNLIGSIALAMPKGNGNPDDAARFVQYLYQPDNYVPFLHSMPLFMFPTMTDASVNERFAADPLIQKYPGAIKATLDGLANGALPGMENGANPYASVVFSSHICEEMFHNILLQKMPIADAVSQTAARMETLISEVKSRL
ncbi:extracellular solute-binding protein [Mesorhizobium sp. AD1-1]|uniref:ABC transporter substrate-binding protein n=1 Tax=Mesorhizobium sp. AD1-1 TaxID=2876621 RepID=UPI001CCE5B1E|nr:extracellular solute-binding protein [Mesorhizobium sp. AD1-1]MBZ9719235.1 extracellular solute-binding protein [Mesorhizobium sp. AD1-1]